MEADEGQKSSRFRCLNVARYVVAAVMTVLIVIISLNTAKLVLYEPSHSPLDLWVAKGFLYVRRAPPAALMFYLGVLVSSHRGFKYYANITTACLLDESTSSRTPNPERVAIICFDDPVPGRIVKAVEQEAGHYFLMETKGTRDAMKRHLHFFDELYINGSSPNDDATLLLTGTFITERRSGYNTTSRNVTYNCGALAVAGGGRDGDYDEVLDSSYEQLCEVEMVRP